MRTKGSPEERSPEPPATASGKPRRRRLMRFGLQVCFSCSVMVIAVGLLAALVIGASLTVPDWIHQKIARNISDSIPGYRLDFAKVSLIVGQDFVPRLALRDVTLSEDTSGPVFNLSEIDVSVAPGALMHGRLHPTSIRLSGTQLVLRRNEGGELMIALPNSRSDSGSADHFARFSEQIEAVLDREEFASLDRIEATNLSLRYEDARADRAWSVDGGHLQLIREGTSVNLRGDVVLLGDRDYATTLEVSYAGHLGKIEADLGVAFRDMPSHELAGQSPALAWLEALDAPISGSLKASIDDAGRLGGLNASLNIGAGVLQPTPAAQPIAFHSARTYFTYKPADQSITFTALSLESKWVSTEAEGKAVLVGMQDGWPRELQAQIWLRDIRANPANLYPAPVKVDAVALDMRLQFDPFALQLGQIAIQDEDRHLVMDGMVRAEDKGWNVSLNAHLDRLSPERLMEIWPQSVKHEARSWIANNVRSAALHDIQFSLRERPEYPVDYFLGFEFNDLETQFIRDVPPIKDATGYASIYDNRFVITADHGRVIANEGGHIDIAGTSFVIPDIRIKRGPATAILKTDSSIIAGLSLLDAPPFRFLTKAGKPVDLSDGRAQVAGRLDFLLVPDLKPDEVAYDLKGSLEDVRSGKLVANKLLTAETLALDVINGEMKISGDAMLGQVPVSGIWTLPLRNNSEGESHVLGKVEISQAFVNEFGIGLPPGSLTGLGSADVEISMSRATPARLVLGSDLAGVGLEISELDWRLSPSQTGRLDVTGTLDTPLLIDRLRLSGAGLVAEGTVRLTADGALDRAEFSEVDIGGWFRSPVTLEGQGAGQVPKLLVNGGTMDIRRTNLGGESSGEGGAVLMRLDLLQISETLALTSFKADLDTRRGMRGTFSGLLNGRAPVTGQVIPQNGRSAFRIVSDEAGAVLMSANLLKQARDGRLDLTLAPASVPGSYDGVLVIDQLRVKDAPTLGALLNTVSVVGLLEQFEGRGMHFNRVEARFRLDPDRLTLLQGSATGASVGISMDGYYDLDRGVMDMQGVLSPVYAINGIGGVLTRAGEGLIGFNYTVKGPKENPTVGVNPLSVLTPSFFREIFRRPVPKVQGGFSASSSGQAEVSRTPSITDQFDR